MCQTYIGVCYKLFSRTDEDITIFLEEFIVVMNILFMAYVSKSVVKS